MTTGTGQGTRAMATITRSVRGMNRATRGPRERRVRVLGGTRGATAVTMTNGLREAMHTSSKGVRGRRALEAEVEARAEIDRARADVELTIVTVQNARGTNRTNGRVLLETGRAHHSAREGRVTLAVKRPKVTGQGSRRRAVRSNSTWKRARVMARRKSSRLTKRRPKSWT